LSGVVIVYDFMSFSFCVDRFRFGYLICTHCRIVLQQALFCLPLIVLFVEWTLSVSSLQIPPVAYQYSFGMIRLFCSYKKWYYMKNGTPLQIQAKPMYTPKNTPHLSSQKPDGHQNGMALLTCPLSLTGYPKTSLPVCVHPQPQKIEAGQQITAATIVQQNPRVGPTTLQ